MKESDCGFSESNIVEELKRKTEKSLELTL
jgi:hypothetical protein